jgi:PadR family transcriptional regulator PadR
MDTSQLLKGVLPAAALSVVAAGDAYGYRILHDLRANGLDAVGDASVYGTLQRLYDSGLLSAYMSTSDTGPTRKYYSITDTGRAALKDSRERWRTFQSIVTRLLEASEGVRR